MLQMGERAPYTGRSGSGDDEETADYDFDDDDDDEEQVNGTEAGGVGDNGEQLRKYNAPIELSHLHTANCLYIMVITVICS